MLNFKSIARACSAPGLMPLSRRSSIMIQGDEKKTKKRKKKQKKVERFFLKKI
jgi:hypothetical protein